MQQGAADAAEAETLAISCEGVSNSLVTQDNNGDTVLHLAIGAFAPEKEKNASEQSCRRASDQPADALVIIQAILQTR